MTTHLVLTVMARDAPGIVERVSEVVVAHGGNWLGSRMARLAGEFAGIVEVSVAAAEADALSRALQSLKGLRIQIAEARITEAPEAAGERPLRLEVVGQDRPGIVREISQALARRGVNVDELETRCESAPMSGEALFKATALLRLPEGVSEQALSDELEKIAGDLMVDLTLD